MLSNKKFFIALCFIVTQVSASYVDQYLVALQDLIKVHKKYFPNEPIQMNSSSLVYSVYKKIITPWALTINGTAHIIQNKFYAKQSYWPEMQTVWKDFVNYQSQVEALEKNFSGVGSQELLNAFYKEIGSDVVQIFFNLIQDASQALSLDEETLVSCFFAYKIASEMYQSDMKLSGIQPGADFTSTMTGNIVVLYQNAIKNLLNQLSIGMLGITKIETIYDQIARYYSYLAEIGTMSKDNQLLTSSQQQAQNACQNYGYYLQAEKLYEQAETLLKKYTQSPALNVLEVKSVITRLEAVGKNIGQVSELIQQAEQYYTQAQDIYGANKSKMLYTLVDNINLWVVQGLAQLWLIFLQDQTAQNIETASTIAAFLESKNQATITNQQVSNAFKNLSGMIRNGTNNINNLSIINVLKEYSIQEIIDSLQKQLVAILQSGVDTDTNSLSFVSLSSIQSAETILFYLTKLADAMTSCLSDSGKLDVALEVMAYAQALDKLYVQLSPTEKNQVNSIIPYFPNQLQTGAETQATWNSWCKAILLKSDVVSISELTQVAIAKVVIAQPKSDQKQVSQSKVTALEKLAYQEALEKKFEDASVKYQQAMNLYTTLYSLNPQETEFYNNMMQAKTFYASLSFAGTIGYSGTVNWKGIQNIPTNYTANQYTFNTINITELGMSQLPASLIGIPAGSEYTKLNSKQQQDIFKLIIANSISQLLSVQGVEFDQIFVDYNLGFKKNVDTAGKGLASAVKSQVQTAFNNFKGSAVSSIVLDDATTIGSVVCTDIPLTDVTPLFSDMATALTFYMSAQLLVKKSSTEIKLGSSSYVAVNSTALSDIFLEKIVKVYVSSAYPLYQEAKKLMNQLSSSLVSDKKLAGGYPTDFENNLKTIDAHILRVQALLYAQGQSAYAYASQGSNTNLAQEIQDIFFGIYQEYTAWMKQCLNGKNPFDPTYQTLLHKINTVYVAWAALLQADNQISKVQAINDDLVDLFTEAGKGCMKISYTEPLYPSFIQYHYATAAHYFIAVQMQYAKMKQTQNADQLNSLIDEAYFKGSSQNVNMFLYVQKNGVTIQHQSSKGSEKVSFSDLISQKVFSSDAKQDAYDSIQNLLLNAGIGYLYIKNKLEKEITTNTKNSTSLGSGLSSNVKEYLTSQKLLESNALQPNYYDMNTITGIFAVNLDAYNQFKNSSTDFASWLDVVYTALQALYGLNYLGATEGETGQQMETQIMEFFTEIEKHTSSLQNPSSAYVG